MAAQAYPYCDSGYTCWYDWFSDADHTTLVGTLHIDCAGRSTSEGIHTSFLSFFQAPC